MFVLLICCFGFIASVNADFAEDCLKIHNEYRSRHQAPDLILDTDLTAGAQTWATELASTGNFKHSSQSDRKGIGENLYFSEGKSLSAKGAVDSWYDEIKYYSFENHKFSSGTGHFTQVVWRNSKKLGCAHSESGRKIYVVARYSPAGNIIGEFEHNVFKSKNGSTINNSPVYFLMLVSALYFTKLNF